MKIHNMNNYMNYKTNNKPIKHENSVKSNNYDVIEINKDKLLQNSKDTNIEKIKKDITLKVNEQTSNEKIQGIRESIKNNTYQVDVDEIVKRLLDR